MNVYLACTVRGDRGAVAALRALVADLEASGHTVLTKHLLEDTVEAAEAALSEREVYDRDIDWLERCDLLVADGSGSSFGVGFEVGYVLSRADRSGQSVVLLYRADRRDVISRLIVGNGHPHCRTIPYTGPEELVAEVRRALAAPARGNRQQR